MLTVEIKTVNAATKTSEWRLSGTGFPHRLNEVAYLRWRNNGRLKAKCYFLNGALHREPSKGPAMQGWQSNGQPSTDNYFKYGEWHRHPSDGPAFVQYNIGGYIQAEIYMMNNRKVNKDDYL